ncbi:hypothetical protein ACFU7T_08695 [Streptomyces sp. NPDC057555]|uniref:hypothetical protein n=1 Tax=Streptomyces sp. NPDC057555 TaxID=3346166 RepID=UPI0036764498
MRRVLRRAPLLTALAATALFAGAGVAQATTGTIEFYDKGENITNPVDGTCYSVMNVNTMGQRDVINHTDRKVRVFLTAGCSDLRQSSVLEPGESFHASSTWFPIIAARSVQLV